MSKRKSVLLMISIVIILINSTGICAENLTSEWSIESFPNENLKVQKKIVKRLTEKGDKSSIESLIIIHKWNPTLRKDVISGLVIIGSPAVESMILLLENRDLDVRMDAIIILGEIRDARAIEPLIGLLEDENIDVQKAAIESIAKIGKPALEFLIDNTKSQNFVVRDNVFLTLVMMNGYAVEPLIGLLKDKEDKIRRDAVIALGNIKDKRATKPLISLLKDKNSDIRISAAYALAEIKDSSAIEPLINFIRNEDLYIQGNIIEAIIKIGSPAGKPLVSAIKDENAGIRMWAVYALGKIRYREAVYLLMDAALHDPDWQVRGNTVASLGELGCSCAIETLILALNERDPYVQSNAIKSLVKIGVPAIGPLIIALGNKNLNIQNNVSEVLIEIGPLAVKPLIAALKAGDLSIKEKAAETICRIKDVNSLELLIPACKDKDPYVRGKVITAFGEIKDNRTVGLLIDTLQDNNLEVRLSAVRALKKIIRQDFENSSEWQEWWSNNRANFK